MDARLTQKTSRTYLFGPSPRQKRPETVVGSLVHAPQRPWGPIEHGQAKPLRAISTLGERAAVLLERAGITDTRLLWAADPPLIATIAGVARETADDWRCIGELLAIQGLPDRHAASLVAAGVGSIEDLCSESAALLLSRIQRHQERHGDPSRRHEVSLTDVQDWIAAANRHSGWAPRRRSAEV